MNRRAPIMKSILIPFFISMAMPVLAVGFPAALTLKRAPQPDYSLLAQRDRARLGRVFKGFNLSGSFEDGLYSTTIRLGSPPKNYHVQIDTGSDVLWVSCNPCNGCPAFENSHTLYDVHNSTTGSRVGCTDDGCLLGASSSQSNCSQSDSVCSFSFRYADGSTTAGYYVSDRIHLGTSVTPSVVFGCSTKAVAFAASAKLIDGILGLGRNSISVIAQLGSKNATPRAFSHCLRSDTDGGGLLAFGAAIHPNMTYTPMIPFRPHYYVNLRSISVNGLLVPFDPSVSMSSNTSGTVIDTGATLLLIADDGYDVVIKYITDAVSSVAVPASRIPNYQCYSSLSSYSSHEFPQIRLGFSGGTFILLGPQDYVFQYSSRDGNATWCLNIVRSPLPGTTILGDVVLRDKVVVYDLAAERIGWVDHDCSLAFNFSTVDTLVTGHPKHGSSVGIYLPRMLLICVLFSWVFL